MKVLDCTFRDGGYQCNWTFPLDLVNKYLRAIEKSKVDAVEIGFRSNPEKEIGPFGKVTDEFIEENIYVPNIEFFGVMLNAKEMTQSIIKKIFTYKDEAKINLVRVAILFKDVEQYEAIFKDIKNLGYTVCCNLMQAADKSYDEIKNIGKVINDWGCVDVIYIADSFGGMDSDSVNYAFKALWENWKGLTGFHAHNNKGQALKNTLEAVDIGVDWIDSTIMGIGRGAGNTETEYLLNDLNKRNCEFNCEIIYDYAINQFWKLKTRYGWGPSLIYYLAAEYNIHPTYPQTLLEKYSVDKVYRAIEFLKTKESSNFNKKLMEESVNE